MLLKMFFLFSLVTLIIWLSVGYADTLNIPVSQMERDNYEPEALNWAFAFRMALTGIPLWLRNRLISAGLELVVSHSEKSCLASYYRQFSTNNKIKKT